MAAVEVKDSTDEAIWALSIYQQLSPYKVKGAPEYSCYFRWHNIRVPMKMPPLNRRFGWDNIGWTVTRP